MIPVPALRALALAERVRSKLRRHGRAGSMSGRHRAAFYEKAWRDAARAVGADVRPGLLGALEIVRDGARVAVRESSTTLDDAATLRRAGHKTLVHHALQAAGLPTPDSRLFTLASIGDAAEFLECRTGPCVVKPARGTGAGQGVTTGVTRRAALELAASVAAGYGPELLIERFVPGDNYRLLYLDGVLLDAVKRDPPTVAGDGRHSTRELVAEENARRLESGWGRAQCLIVRDRDMVHTLAREGLTLRSVPEMGRRVLLKTAISDNAARDTEPAVDRLCPEIIRDGARAAEAIGIRLAGVDVITPDPTRPLSETGGVILEVNTTPGLYHHLRGDACPVTIPILQAMLADAAGVKAPRCATRTAQPDVSTLQSAEVRA